MMKKKEPIKITSLIVSVVILILGILLCFNGDEALFKLLGYIVSAFLLLFGVIKLISYAIQKKKYNAPFTDCMSGVLLVGLAIFIFVFPGVISTTISIAVGALILINGINRLILGLAVRSVDKEGSKVFTIVSICMIILGIIILTGKFFNLIGIFLIMYSISEIFGYIYYISQKKDYSQVLNKEVPKEMKEKEAKEAIIEEK